MDTGGGILNLLVTNHRNPLWNLAVEEALLGDACNGRSWARIWVNSRSVIIGRGLNPCDEVRCDTARELGIGVYRRSSGGGAVYHDEGNLNFTMVVSVGRRVGVDEAYSAGLTIMLQALRLMGVQAWIENGNDIVVDGVKVSGSAAHITRCGFLFHATLLIDADMETLRQVIKPRLDRVARGEVTPAKYNPGNLSEIAGASRGSAISALLEVLSTKYLIQPAEMDTYLHGRVVDIMEKRVIRVL